MAKLAIVGNGPSRRLFPGYHDGPVMLCNIPQLVCEYSGLCIIDEKCFNWYKQSDFKPHRPIYTTGALENKFKQIGIETVYGVFEKKLMNVAQTAALHFAKDFDEITLYGCDALWSKNVSSSCDANIHRPPRGANLHNRWRAQWEEVWQTQKTFEIVQPFNYEDESENPNYGKNVFFSQHSMPANKEVSVINPKFTT